MSQEKIWVLLTAFVAFSVFLVSFVSNRKHLLLTLLTLEGLMLMVFSLLTLVSLHWSPMPIFILIFLTLVACEGALGLSLLVSVIRTHGSDHVNSLNSL
uniref:NADH dehydrogenase subunit 4L n=1 Tax=Podonevadne trigona TaxID=141406 RepID=UPI002E7A555E|nr:NADH dehydrogenase subunit 4L [Podonevadne trigona]WPT28351.1 NADH dehydrogenase subunit 4L [Podonevadne trigona]